MRPAATASLVFASLLVSGCVRGGYATARGAPPCCAEPIVPVEAAVKPPTAPTASTTPTAPSAPAAPYADADTAALPREVWEVANPRAWTVIVLHHSASQEGGAARFDGLHRAKGWDGVGYDFVVGNGTDTKDGEIETTFRWKEQRDGAHVKGWNDLAIGICLVGNFEETDPTAKQTEAVVRLLRHLRRRFHVPPQRVVGHGNLGTTACPGKRLPLAALVAASAPVAEAPSRP